MDVGVEGLLVAAFLVLPGFLASAIQRIFLPRAFASTSAWVGTSVLRSMAFAVVAVLVYATLVEPVDLEWPVVALPELLGAKTLLDAAILLGLLYGLAVLWGLLTGLKPGLSFQSLAFLRRLTPISPEADVWHLALGARFRTPENLALPADEQEVPWLRVQLSDTRAVVGRMQFSSVMVEQENPIEVYLSPVYDITAAGLEALILAPGAVSDGLYLRLTDEMHAEVFAARGDWPPP